MTAAMLTELGNPTIKPVLLISMHFATISYITTHVGNLIFGGNTYISSSKFLSVSNLREAFNDENNEIVIEYSGAHTASISEALSQSYFGVTVKIYLGLINSSNALIADPALWYQGRIITFSFSEDPIEKTSTLTWRVASIWTDFDKTSGRRTNNHDQQLYSSGDLFFDHAGQIIKDIKWGTGG